jgi:hypothetical protein
VNVTSKEQHALEAEERAEIASQLPAPNAPGLSTDRHRILREFLMSEIEQAASHTGVTARRRRRLRRVAWGLGPLVAAAVALAIVLGGIGDGIAPGRPGVGTPPVGTRPGPDTTATSLLGRVALMAEQRPSNPIRNDQFIYVESLEAWWTVYNTGPGRGKLHRFLSWDSVDGTRPGWVIDQATGQGVPTQVATHRTIVLATYRDMEALPTDPQALLDLIYAQTASLEPSCAGSQTSWAASKPSCRDVKAFSVIDLLLRKAVLPPKLAGALYRAAGMISGVTLINDVVDAAGRHGIAVSCEDGGSVAFQWIFDAKSLEYLGAREIALTDLPGIKAGDVMDLTAVVRAAVVDKVRQVPGR